MKYSKFFLFILTFLFSAILLIEICSASWQIALSIDVGINKTNEAVCYNSTTNIYYSSLNKAVNSASKNDKIYVIPGSNFEVTSSINLDNEISIYIPYDGIITKDFSKGTISRKTLITFKNGADLTIGSSSTFEIGAQIGTNGITGSYCEVSLDKNSSIIVNGKLNVYGKITETNKVTGYDNLQNVIYNNSSDSERFIHVTSSGTLDTVFSTLDIGSGSTMTSKVDANICPTYNFQFPCLQTYVSLEYGSYMKAWAYINIMNSDKSIQIGVVYPSSSNEKSIFYQVSGSVSLEWCSDSKTIIYINGETNMGSIYISASGFTIDSDKMFVPIYQRFSIYVDGTFNTNGKRIKFLPGSYLKILDGSYFNINGTGTSSTTLSKVIFYEGNSLTSLGITNYGNTNSICINNGSIVLNTYGALAGYITTEKTDGSACVDLRNVTNADYLTLSDVEMVSGTAINIPDINLYGPFYDSSNVDNEYMTNSVFNSGVISYSNIGYPYWNGTIKTIETVTLTVLKTGAQSEAFNYSIYTNTSDSDSGQNDVISFNTTTRTQSLTLNTGTYIKIVDSVSTTITLNGELYISGTWVLVDKSLDFEITPTASFTISCYHTTGTSGAGKIERTITYDSSPSFDINPQTVTTSNGSKITANVPYGWYFKVSDNANVSGISKVVKITYDEDGNTTKTTLSETTGKLAWDSLTVYVSDGDYEFTSDNVNCIVEGTLITMADGTKKKVEDIISGDLVQVFNHETGQIDIMPILFNNHSDQGTDLYTILNIEFANGNSLRIVGDEGLFNKTLNKYVYLNIENYMNYIGHEFVSISNGQILTTKLTKGFITEEYVKIYSPNTPYFFNRIANSMLTIPGEIDGTFNIFEYDENMKYNEELMKKDIETYGLFTYEDFKEYMSYEVYCCLPAPYFKVAIGKGILTWEQLKYYIDMYAEIVQDSLGSG
ncbi:MAG: hypothetical protein HPY96_04400 [Bacilli bacterium]|jgi:hypothetical protein|nr:hypothetical protein [Bacilli bacterium]